MNLHAPQRGGLSHDARLDRLAEVTIRVGLGLSRARRW